MTTLRERWEGVSLPGDHLLERWLDGGEDAGFFESSTTPDGRLVIVKVVPETAVDAPRQLARWQRTRQLRHPNLLELLDCGRAELAGETVLYGVFESADDSLASALANGPLSEVEALEVLEAVVSGLRYLESQGLGIPVLEPQNVVAVGERIKLSTDALGDVPPGTLDRAQLREFWSRISPCTAMRSAEILARALGPGASIAAEALPPAAPEPPAPVPPAFDRAQSSPKRFPKWIVVGAAGVVLLILGLNYRRTPEAPAQQPSAPIATAPAVAAPIAATPFVKPSPPKVTTDKPSPLGNGSWRVIAFTFRTRDAATRKADQINQRHPELAAAALSLRGKSGSYVISLGGRMSRGDAERMEKMARAAHVARDVRLESGLD